MNSVLNLDGYKIGHIRQYIDGIQYVNSNLTARGSRMEGVNHIVFFELQRFIKKWLIDDFNRNFFRRPKSEVVSEYKRIMDNYLGKDSVNVDHITALHDLQYLPLKIKALPEGSKVPLRVPFVTIVNTNPKFFWLTNYIETLFSCEMWQGITSATIANEYRKILDYYAYKTVGENSFVKFQGHDFSMRGMSSVETARMSGSAHLLNFVGTDTVPAILELEKYYNANSDIELIGCSVPATEHSVMSSSIEFKTINGQQVSNECEVFERLITKVYPNGIVSIVSDTFDLFKVLTEYLPKLKDKILARNGTLTIRPDSGDPVKIICGDSNALVNSPEYKGVIELLYDTFGGEISNQGFKVLDSHVKAIYGDSITLDRAQQICQKLFDKGFASTNIILGIGSYTYNYNTRDVFSMAQKSTWCQVDGIGRAIFKDPKTDDGTKKSAKGLLKVEHDGTDYYLVDNCTVEQEKEGHLRTVFEDGKLLYETSLSEIRNLLFKDGQF